MFDVDQPISVVKMTKSLSDLLDGRLSFGSTFYIGRGSPLGNPYSSKRSKHDVTYVADRDEAIKRFGDDLRGGMLDKSAYEFLGEIILVSKSSPITLVCFCKPQCCHGDVIRDYIISGRENAKI